MNTEYYTKKFIYVGDRYRKYRPRYYKNSPYTVGPTVFDNTINSEMPDLEGPSDSESNDFTFLKL